jgi:aldehyde dehydrogenase (NAD+)
MCQENIAAIEYATHLDSGRASVQAIALEIVPVVRACAFALERLDEWTSPESPPVDPDRASWNINVYPIPKGVVLLITCVYIHLELLEPIADVLRPWNGPWVITFGPFIGALAAGCAAVIKPSELSSATSALMATLLPKYLDATAYAIVNGAVEETQALLDLRWDHILFTGGTMIGKIVAVAAARHLTPVTLELGGKSPVIVDSTCDIALAAKRTLYGKIQISGQVANLVRSRYMLFLTVFVLGVCRPRLCSHRASGLRTFPTRAQEAV